jgi:predicted SAM-dependent methyltransferase
MEDFFRHTKIPALGRLFEVLLALRALLFVGTRYTCPLCGWRLRAFTHGGTSFRARHRGYCPRCNSKARHRRIWLYLEEKTNLFSHPLRLFHVSPKFSLSRRFSRMENLDYVGVDLNDRRNINAWADITATPIRSATFDAVICIHVLEEIEQDLVAMRELYRVLKPGGWAVISVPTRLDQETYEDPTITAAKERLRAFGEEAHVRIYGGDLRDRLESCGFQVQLDLAQEIGQQTMEKYGLADDENIFYCTKA